MMAGMPDDPASSSAPAPADEPSAQERHTPVETPAQATAAPPRRGWPVAAIGAGVAVFAIALAVRLGVLSHVADAPSMKELRGDARGYDAWAQRIAAGDWIGRETFYQPPLYPYLLGALYRVAGRDLHFVRVVQAVLGSLACVLVAVAARRLFTSRTIGTAAGLLLALYPAAVFFDLQIEKTVLDGVLVAVLLVQVAALLDAQRTW